MEQITRVDGRLYYGTKQCMSVDDAYSRFRDDYHRSLGREKSNRLDRLGQRKERIHGFGFVFSGDVSGLERFGGGKRYRCRLMGLVGISYVRGVGIWDYPDVADADFDDWLDWIFSRGNKSLITTGICDKVGRTNKRKNTRYR